MTAQPTNTLWLVTSGSSTHKHAQARTRTTHRRGALGGHMLSLTLVFGGCGVPCRAERVVPLWGTCEGGLMGEGPML
jgi:hypothetical protein